MNPEFIKLLPQVISLVATAVQYAGANNAVPKILTLLGTIAEAGAAAYDDLVRLRDMVLTMIREGRDPTPDEWASLNSRSDQAHAAIQGAVIDDQA